MINKKIVTALVLFTALSCFTLASGAAQYPKPVGYINDFAGVLSSGSVQKLEGVLNELKSGTGAEVAVVTVKDMGGLDESTYAVELMKEWGVGSKERNEGILLLVAVKERRIRIEVGYGLEYLITDAMSGQIIDRYIVPSLKQNDYDTGISQGALAIASMIANDKGMELNGTIPAERIPGNQPKSGRGIAPFINLIVILFIFFILSRSRGGRGFLAGMLIGNLLGGGNRRYYGGGFGGGFGSGGGFGGFGGGFSGGGGASRGF